MNPKIKKLSPVVKMTSKKVLSFSTTGIIPYILILIILVGLFGPMERVNSQELPKGTCSILINNIEGITTDIRTPNITEAACQERGRSSGSVAGWTQNGTTGEKTLDTTKASSGDSTPFLNDLYNNCSIFTPSGWGDCLLILFYYTYFQIPALLLWVSAYLFNVLLRIGIDSAFTSSANFIPVAWAVVRDLSNIFFILVLLYVAIQTILGIGHETKKIIVNVIIMALLINFSMFFTKVIIDSSNILALVFYNNIKVNPSRPFETTTSDTPNKDFAGEMFDKFNATKLIDQEGIEDLKKIKVFDQSTGTEVETKERIPTSLKFGMMLIAGSIMLVAAYAFFVAGFAFLARLIELWVLIIFSPFAFMSWTLPTILGHIEYIGWDSWHKRLIKVAFMAPIFMFFLYLIFLLIQADPLGKAINGQGTIVSILSIFIPGLIILYLLLKATKFAKEGAGKLGEIASGLAKVVGGLAIGAATGGTAMLAAKGLQGTVGRAGMGLAKSTRLAGWETSESSAFKRFVGGKLRTITGSDEGKGGLAGSTFDIRKGVLSGALGTVSKLTGVSMGMGSKGGFLSTEEGGYAADLERRHAKRDKRNEGLKNVVKADAEKDLNKAKIAQRELSSEASHAIGLLDKKIEDLGKKRGQGIKGSDEDKEIVKDIKALVQQKADIKGIKGENYDALASLAKTAKTNAENAARTGAANAEELKKIAEAAQMSARIAKISRDSADGNSIKDYEDKILPGLEHDVDKAVRGIEKRFISNLEKQWMPPWRNAERQASVEKLRLGVKGEKKSKSDEHHDLGALGHIAIETLGHVFSNDGHDKDKGSAPHEPPK